MALERCSAGLGPLHVTGLSPSVRDFVPWPCRWHALHEDYLTNNDGRPEKMKQRDQFVKCDPKNLSNA